MRRELNDSLFTCDDCGRSFKTNEGLKIHSYKHISDRPHKCQLCLKSYVRLAHLKRHTKVTHGKFIQSLNTDKSSEAAESDTNDDSLSQNSVLLEQLSDTKSNGNVNIYQCQYCINYYVKKKYLEKHMQTHHANEEKNSLYKTEDDQYSTHLNSHDSSVKDIERVKCDVCDRVYMSKAALLKHSKKHLSTHLKTRVCPYCNRNFTDYVLFLRHKSSHLRNTSHQCTLCHKTYSKKIYLLKHVCNKTTKEAYVCTLCEMTFLATRDFNKHLRREHVIQRDNTVDCKICNKSFLQLNYFIKHFKKQHTGNTATKFDCDICGKKYSKKKYLLKHKLQHGEHEQNGEVPDENHEENIDEMSLEDSTNGWYNDEEIYLDNHYGGIAFIPE